MYSTISFVLQLLFSWKTEAKPLLFVLFSSVLFFYGSLRYNFFSIIPVTFSSLINSMDDSVLRIDADFNVASFNNSLTRLIPEKDVLKITEICRESILNNVGNVEANLKSMIQTTKDGLNRISSSIYYQKNKSIENNIFVKTLEKLLTGKTSMNIQIFLEGATRIIPYPIRYLIYITCREVLENSCAKRQAKTVYIILQSGESSFNMIITDDGKGCDNVESAKGLQLIENMCHELGGIINYGSLDENHGFSLHMELPY
ncbi:MAG: sensory histidine kinase UhpB [Firmicutes bacterium ADurb.Bin419]|nr:MAG: sensory histidine kinase UhpB [Firmicutes bacterium ADurb.Bin419]